MFLNLINNLLFRMTSEIKLYMIVVYFVHLCSYSSIHHFLKEESASRANQSIRNIEGLFLIFLVFCFFSVLALPPAVVKLFLHTQTGRVVIKVCTAGNYDVCINRWRAGKPQTPPSSLSFTSFSVVLLL